MGFHPPPAEGRRKIDADMESCSRCGKQWKTAVHVPDDGMLSGKEES